MKEEETGMKLAKINSNFNDCNLKIKSNIDNIKALYESIEQTNLKIQELSDLKGDKSQIDDIDVRLSGFANIEHIDTLKNYFLPKIEVFAKHIDKFMFDNTNMRECIVRFDEDMSMKCYKSDLLVL